MVHSYDRASRVEDQILREVSNILLHRVKDPRLTGVTITRVRLTRDLKRGVVFYSTLDQRDEALRDAARGLDSAKGFIKMELGSRIRIKFMPSITFEPDPESEARKAMVEEAESLD